MLFCFMAIFFFKIIFFSSQANISLAFSPRAHALRIILASAVQVSFRSSAGYNLQIKSR